jgi:flavodoxin
VKILVTYYSKTGNTEKVARAIFDTLQGQKEILPLDQAADIEKYDLVFLGFPIMQFSPARKARSFLKTSCQGKKSPCL